MKNFKVKKLVAIFLVTAMATMVIAGCSKANEREKESSKESIAANLVEDSEKSLEEETSFAESVVESAVESEVESSAKPEVENAESSVESEIVSVDSSVESELSDSQSSVEEASAAVTSSTSEASVQYSLSDIIRYGRTLQATPLKLNGEYLNTCIANNFNICILKINSDTYDIYYKGQAATIDASQIELYPEDYIPDFSPEIPWYGFTFEERGSLINSN